ncbi:MAG: SMI1/KNR4 family protein [Gemmataceae bacterium]
MTEAQLAEIEAAVGFALPDEYQRVAIAPPFRPIGRDWVYWFYNDPARVIDGTLAPLADGDYDRAEWRAGYLTIGESGAGDLYVMDTAAAGLPIHCLSHESHRIETEYETFAAFVEEWMQAPEKHEASLAAEGAAERAEWHGRLRRTFVFVVCAIPASLLFAALVSWLVLWLRK